MAGSSEFTVQRVQQIDASPEVVFSLVDHLESWQKWSPWEGLDPNLSREYTGPDSGKGARYAWKGNKKVGEGNMTIAESVSPSKVGIDLAFLKPFKSESKSIIEIAAKGDQSMVTWTMKGQKNWFMKLFGFIFSMEKMVGGDFERGLAKLKTVAESAAGQG
ncbi:MAG: SRPBCC family protein [Myxococcales bacterium]|nr:SRPBCC family protein [Myxococcales bacterium]